MLNKLIAGLLVYALCITQVMAQATLVPNAKQTFLGTTGAPLASGTVTMYVPNSTNLKTTWVDPSQASNNQNPIPLDAAGRAIIFGQGNYRQVVKDKNGVVAWDSFTSALGSSQPSGATGTDTAPVGTIVPYSGFSIPINWQLSYGQALSRTTYSQLLTAITIVDKTASCTNSSTTISGLASTAMMSVGDPIEATCFSTGVTIASIVNSSTITISSAASATNTVTTTVFPWGNGDGVSTFNVPDLRGRVFAGADAMGGAAAARLTTTYYGASAGAPAVSGGSQSGVIAQANLPALTLTTNIPSGEGSHTHTIPAGPAGNANATRAGNWDGTGGGNSFSSIAATLPAMTGTTLTGGSGTPLATIQPTITVNYIIKVAQNTTGAGGVVSIGGMFGDIICDATFLCTNQTIGLATQANNTILGNVSGGALTPTAITLTQWMDSSCGNASGDILYRSASIWTCLPPGVNGQAVTLVGGLPAWTSLAGTGTVTSVALTAPSIFSVTGSPVTSTGTIAVALTTQTANLVFSGPSSGSAAIPTFRSLVSSDIPAGLVLGTAGSIRGSLTLSGLTSGTPIIVPQSVALTPTLTLPTASGTFVVSGSAPLVVSATTGNITCPTCSTSSGGGAVTGTAPIAVSAAGVVSITGLAGGVLAGSSPAFTTTPTLGASGTLGTISFGNATSGTITLQPAAGALTASVLTLPAATDTVAVLAASQAFTNKTYNGNTWTAGTGVLTIAAAKTLTASNSITLAGTDATTMTFPSTNGTVASLNIADQTLSGGANVTSSNQGTKSSGTFTVDCGASPLQYITNGGAFTLAAPANDGSCIVRSLNNGSAGTITFSGFTVGSNTGDGLTTTNASAFAIQIWRINGVSRYLISAYQ